jgi:hypothetical protein
MKDKAAKSVPVIITDPDAAGFQAGVSFSDPDDLERYVAEARGLGLTVDTTAEVKAAS